MNDKKSPLERQSGQIAAKYLFKKLKYPFKDWQKFWDLIRLAVERDKNLYRQISLSKRGGGKRVILIPCEELKYLQRLISQRLLADISGHPNASGFSEGSIREALLPIVRAKQPIFCADVKDAFPETTFGAVFSAFQRCKYGYNSSYFLTYLTTWRTYQSLFYNSALPQGAPTSPRLFDLCFEPIDNALAKFAAKIGGVYTRYADNIFFTAPTFWPARKSCRKVEGETIVKDKHGFETYYPYKRKISTIPEGKADIDKSDSGALNWHSPVISAIYQIVHTKGKGTYYQLHKSYLCDKGQLLHALGLNLINGQLHNTREFKRHLRLTIFNLQKSLSAQDDFGNKIWPLYQKLNGMMQFAIKETLPVSLVQQWEELDLAIYQIRYPRTIGT
ncbi:MAG: hypothetical protein A2Y82_01745 [Candidatus Buchananbacteria bacterium RBG_13_36_9]|uniref:Reverse transcriptase domain-containing protein n=1 Tax=Candidatus Buchananbacteria bacterium RBG_13_36_9 TaxID=1797530 RepID=A0A1G1XRC6_9BACT|nr:MAG: hypothetical protein A2Y82_01745 [Candidatus Buchananbacteria bacterium RBG_13_36_9]